MGIPTGAASGWSLNSIVSFIFIPLSNAGVGRLDARQSNYFVRPGAGAVYHNFAEL